MNTRKYKSVAIVIELIVTIAENYQTLGIWYSFNYEGISTWELIKVAKSAFSRSFYQVRYCMSWNFLKIFSVKNIGLGEQYLVQSYITLVWFWYFWSFLILPFPFCELMLNFLKYYKRGKSGESESNLRVLWTSEVQGRFGWL